MEWDRPRDVEARKAAAASAATLRRRRVSVCVGVYVCVGDAHLVPGHPSPFVCMQDMAHPTDIQAAA